MELPKFIRKPVGNSSAWVRSARSLRYRQNLIDIALALIILIAGFAWYNSGVETQGYHLDESRWINRAHYLSDLRDPFGPTWNHQYLSRGQPPVGSYSIGLGLIVQGQDLETNPAWDFRRPRPWNEIYGNLPSNDDLMAARRWNAFLGAASAAVLYIAVRRLSNPVGGIVAAIFLLTNPLEIWYNRIALADSTLTFTLALLYLATIAFMRKPRWWLAIGIGILIGLGGGNKFTPLALSIPLAGIGGLLLLRAWWFGWRHRNITSTSFWRLPPFTHISWMLISTPFVALATFIASYPYLWPDPIHRIQYMLAFRRMEMDNQYRLNPHFQTNSPTESLQMAYDTLGNKWSSTLQIFRWFDLEHIGIALSSLDLWFAIIGTFALLAVGVVKGLRSAELAVAALIIFQIATIMLNMRVVFERYYLPMMVGEFLAIGLVVGYAVSLLLPKATRIDLRLPEEHES